MTSAPMLHYFRCKGCGVTYSLLTGHVLLCPCGWAYRARNDGNHRTWLHCPRHGEDDPCWFCAKERTAHEWEIYLSRPQPTGYIPWPPACGTLSTGPK